MFMLNKKFLIKIDPVEKVTSGGIAKVEKYLEESSTGTIVQVPLDTSISLPIPPRNAEPDKLYEAISGTELIGKRVGFRSACVMQYDKEHRIVHERDLDWIE